MAAIPVGAVGEGRKRVESVHEHLHAILKDASLFIDFGSDGSDAKQARNCKINNVGERHLTRSLTRRANHYNSR